MKIFNKEQIEALDIYTIENEPITSIELMERAARTMLRTIKERWDNRTPFIVFAGPGNNGGDALIISRILTEESYKVKTYLFNIKNKLSPDCNEAKERLIKSKASETFTEVLENFEPPKLDEKTVVIDGLFGSGLSKVLVGGFASLVKYINSSPSKVVSLDLPSGLMVEDNDNNVSTHIIKADLTLTLQQKKLSMLFADTQQYIGELKVLDIQLNKEYIENEKTTYYILEESDIKSKIKTRIDFAHKGDMGHALLLAGSYGMAGAAILATKAAMRTGVGKTTIYTPQKNNEILQISCPEAITYVTSSVHYITDTINAEDYDAVGIGPGIGQVEDTAIATISQIRRTKKPIVLDADALNILASHKAWMQQLPKDIILTPHPKEFDRLDNSFSRGCYERLQKAREMAKRLEIYIILKGHYSALSTPAGEVFFCPTGNAGMATAGSGDVLTGMITALLARGYSKKDACIVGMYLHGLAGDLAKEDLGSESLIASDIISYIPKAFKYLQ